MGFRIGRAIGRIFRPITNLIGGRRHGGGGGEVIEQTQKIEIQYRDPPPDKDYIKLSELVRMTVPFTLKPDIAKVDSSYLMEHFGLNRAVNLTDNPRLKWTLFGYNYYGRHTYNLKDLIGKNYDESWLPEVGPFGQLVFSGVMNTMGKVSDFKELHELPISYNWQSGIFECRRAFFVQTIGATVNVYNRVYKRVGYTPNTLPPPPPAPPKPQEVNVTIICKLNEFEPNKDGHHLDYKNPSGQKFHTWYYPSNNVTINIKVPYGTVFNANKLSYNNTVSPINCPQFTCNRDETVTYVFHYNPRMNISKNIVSGYVNVTELTNWVKYGGGQSPEVPFLFNYDTRSHNSRDKDDWRGRHDGHSGKSGEGRGRS